jgi:ATP-binding cassette subfamily B protein
LNDAKRPARKSGIRELTPDMTFGKAYDARLLKRLWTFVRPHRWLLALAMLTYPLGSFLQTAQPYLVKRAIDRHIVPHQMEGFSQIIAAYAGLAVLEFVARYLQATLSQLLGQRVIRELRLALFRQLQVVDLAFIERNPIGRLMTRVTSDVESIAEMFSGGAVSILGDFFTFGAIVIVMLSMSWKLTLYAFSVLPVMLGVVVLFRGYAREAFRLMRTHLARINGFLNESLSGMTIIQAFRQEERMQGEFEDITSAYRDATFLSIRFDALIYAVVEGIVSIAIAMVLLLGFQMFESGSAQIGLFVAFVDYLRRFFAPITELATKYTVLQLAMASSERIFDLLDEKPSVLDPKEPRPMPRFERALEMRGVSFGYGDQLVLRDVSLSVRRGEKVAIVGPTGAGKSTMVKLLDRFYDPREGQILIDGVDLRDVALDELRKRMALVLQDAYLFDGTIKDNIAFADETLDEGALEKAAERTQALDLIRRCPEGWKTRVGERGARFSSGERQLIAFARTLAADPEILILDEATSAVDPETEARIQRGVDALIKDRTALIIAHRLSTIRKVDRIVVLVAGRIAEEGSHDQLMAKGGIYKSLYELQFADNVERPAA